MLKFLRIEAMTLASEDKLSKIQGWACSYELNKKNKSICKNQVLHFKQFQILEELSLSKSSLWTTEVVFVTSLHWQQHYLGSLQYKHPWRFTMRMPEKVPDLFCIRHVLIFCTTYIVFSKEGNQLHFNTDFIYSVSQ